MSHELLRVDMECRISDGSVGLFCVDSGRCKIIYNWRIEVGYRIWKTKYCGKLLLTEKPKSSVFPTSINDIQWRKKIWLYVRRMRLLTYNLCLAPLNIFNFVWGEMELWGYSIARRHPTCTNAFRPTPIRLQCYQCWIAWLLSSWGSDETGCWRRRPSRSWTRSLHLRPRKLLIDHLKLFCNTYDAPTVS